MAIDPLKLTITLVATTVLILLLIALTAYTFARYGGPHNFLRQRRLRREARRKAADIEADLKRLDERQKKAHQQIALETLEGLYLANNLVGSGPMVKIGSEEGRGKDSFELAGGAHRGQCDLAVDPMAYTWGSGKVMAGMYGK
jgi:hypothetical protein